MFDSPAKTREEIEWALQEGVTLNADNLAELERIDSLQKSRATPSESVVGLRVNPIVSGGSIEMFAVSKPTSKFGHPLHTGGSRAEAVDAFAKYPWLSCIMAHVGSAGTSLEMLAEGAAKVVALADEVDDRFPGRVKVLDIGGGLPCGTDGDEVLPTWEDYARVLREKAPGLFREGGRRVFTEFGRAMLLKSGLIVTRVEYVKQPAVGEGEEPLRTAIVQAGADLLLRACYNPGHYSHRVDVFDASGIPLDGATRGVCRHNIAGPLCFAGDYVKKGVVLPRLEEGDHVVIRDCGANTLSLFSRHCSRLAPPVYSYTRKEAAGELVLKLEMEGERVEDMLEFWNRAPRPSRPLPIQRQQPPTDTCLLVVDVQPEYWSACKEVRAEFPKFPANLAKTVAACRKSRNAVVWIRADYSASSSPWLPRFAELNADKRTQIPFDKDSAQWEDFARPRPGELIVPKPSWGVKDTALLDWLKLRDFKKVLVCGLITSVCVQQTAFSCFEAGFNVVVVENACADRGRARHDAALLLYSGYMYNVEECDNLHEDDNDDYDDDDRALEGEPTVLTANNYNVV